MEVLGKRCLPSCQPPSPAPHQDEVHRVWGGAREDGTRVKPLSSCTRCVVWDKTFLPWPQAPHGKMSTAGLSWKQRCES